MRPSQPAEIVALLTGEPLVIMLDIDGTLCELVEHPDDAAVPESATRPLRALLAESAAGGTVHVVFVTGRSVADAQRMLGLDGVEIYGNHGMERSARPRNIHAAEGSDQANAELRDSVSDLSSIVSTFPGTSMEDKDFSLTLHYRGMDMTRLPELRSMMASFATRHGLRLSPGKCVFNILPAVGLTKGDAAREIIRETGASGAGASILFVGDDITDEDAFRELQAFPDAVTVRVGGSADDASAARLSLAGTSAVHEMLSLLAQSRA